MNFNHDKFVCLEEGASDRWWSSERHCSSGNGHFQAKIRRMMRSIMQTLSWQNRILDPQEPFLRRWNKICLFFCFVALAVDPLFFYIPLIDGINNCLDLDEKMKITACVLRSAIDIFYIFHIILQFRTGFIAPSARGFGRGELVDDPCVISRKYLSSYFLVDILAILPIPQFTVLVIVPLIDGPTPLFTKELLKYAVFIQFVPRIIRILPLRKVTGTGILNETAWAKAAFNLSLYMLASHAVGAIWYMLSIERENTCWHRECHKDPNCNSSALYCDVRRIAGVDYRFLNSGCALVILEDINSTTFDFGIYLDALQSKVVESTHFSNKVFYCFWWGLRNLSSLGQNLKTSTNEGEIAFAVCISISGLLLFVLLIGNLQKHLQSNLTVRIEELKVKRLDAELWMSHRMLPEGIRERVRRYEKYKWETTSGVEEEQFIRTLPKDLRRDIKRYLCLDLLKRVPMFEKMDEQLLEAMCDRLKPVLYTKKSSIIHEGDPIDEMLFITHGTLVTMTTNGGRSTFFNSCYLKEGDFCGDELLLWALDPSSTSVLPTSTRTLETLTEVEAFALMPDDVKFVASQFRRHFKKQCQHTFRFYSQQWRTWAACYIQAAWRRCCRRKRDEALCEVEDRLQDALTRETGIKPSLHVTIYASRFAANALRALRRGGTTPHSKIPPKLPPLLLQKPTEPDFTVNDGYRCP